MLQPDFHPEQPNLTPEHTSIIEVISPDRFALYLRWAKGDPDRAIELYTLNMQLCESLYTCTHVLEVTLRNRIHAVMTAAYNTSWIMRSDLVLIPNQRDQVTKAIEDLIRQRKHITDGRIIASLTFSFWTLMFNGMYEDLWHKTLHQIAKKPNGRDIKRVSFESPLIMMRDLRNRAAHHEPIIKKNLLKHHADILQMIEWLSPAAHDWCVKHCRFRAVHPPIDGNIV